MNINEIRVWLLPYLFLGMAIEVVVVHTYRAGVWIALCEAAGILCLQTAGFVCHACSMVLRLLYRTPSHARRRLLSHPPLVAWCRDMRLGTLSQMPVILMLLLSWRAQEAHNARQSQWSILLIVLKDMTLSAAWILFVVRVVLPRCWRAQVSRTLTPVIARARSPLHPSLALVLDKGRLFLTPSERDCAHGCSRPDTPHARNSMGLSNLRALEPIASGYGASWSSSSSSVSPISLSPHPPTSVFKRVAQLPERECLVHDITHLVAEASDTIARVWSFRSRRTVRSCAESRPRGKDEKSDDIPHASAQVVVLQVIRFASAPSDAGIGHGTIADTRRYDLYQLDMRGSDVDASATVAAATNTGTSLVASLLKTGVVAAATSRRPASAASSLLRMLMLLLPRPSSVPLPRLVRLDIPTSRVAYDSFLVVDSAWLVVLVRHTTNSINEGGRADPPDCLGVWWPETREWRVVANLAHLEVRERTLVYCNLRLLADTERAGHVVLAYRCTTHDARTLAVRRRYGVAPHTLVKRTRTNDATEAALTQENQIIDEGVCLDRTDLKLDVHDSLKLADDTADDLADACATESHVARWFMAGPTETSVVHTNDDADSDSNAESGAHDPNSAVATSETLRTMAERKASSAATLPHGGRLRRIRHWSRYFPYTAAHFSQLRKLWSLLQNAQDGVGGGVGASVRFVTASMGQHASESTPRLLLREPRRGMWSMIHHPGIDTAQDPARLVHFVCTPTHVYQCDYKMGWLAANDTILGSDSTPVVGAKSSSDSIESSTIASAAHARRMPREWRVWMRVRCWCVTTAITGTHNPNIVSAGAAAGAVAGAESATLHATESKANHTWTWQRVVQVPYAKSVDDICVFASVNGASATDGLRLLVMRAPVCPPSLASLPSSVAPPAASRTWMHVYRVQDPRTLPLSTASAHVRVALDFTRATELAHATLDDWLGDTNVSENNAEADTKRKFTQETGATANPNDRRMRVDALECVATAVTAPSDSCTSLSAVSDDRTRPVIALDMSHDISRANDRPLAVMWRHTYVQRARARTLDTPLRVLPPAAAGACDASGHALCTSAVLPCVVDATHHTLVTFYAAGFSHLEFRTWPRNIQHENATSLSREQEPDRAEGAVGAEPAVAAVAQGPDSWHYRWRSHLLPYVGEAWAKLRLGVLMVLFSDVPLPAPSHIPVAQIAIVLLRDAPSANVNRIAALLQAQPDSERLPRPLWYIVAAYLQSFED